MGRDPNLHISIICKQIVHFLLFFLATTEELKVSRKNEILINPRKHAATK